MKIITYTINGLSFTLADLIVYAAIILTVVLWYYKKWNDRYIDRLDSKIRGPKAYPIVGIAHHFLGTSQRKKNISIQNSICTHALSAAYYENSQ